MISEISHSKANIKLEKSGSVVGEKDNVEIVT